MRQFTSVVLLLLLVLSTTIPTIPLVAREGKALIISNEYDMKAADLLEIELGELGFTVEVDNAMKDRYDYYFILGGPLAKDVGRISRKYLPSEEAQALINVKGYWTFTVKPEKGHVVVIAGNTREETFQATRLLVERGIIRFITDRSINVAPPLSSQEIRNVTTLRYQWKFPPKVGKDYEISVQIPLPLVDFFKIKPRMKVAEFNESRGTLIFTWYLMARTPHDDPYISSLVEEMDKLAERDGIKDYRKLWFIASFVQHLRYSLASEFSKTGDYPSYPIETLYRGAGDCEDLSILLIALYRQAGYDSALLIMPTHAAVAVSMPSEWVKWPRVKARLVDLEGTSVVLVDLNDLLNKFMTNDVVALEFELDGKKYYYVRDLSVEIHAYYPHLTRWNLAYVEGFCPPIEGEPLTGFPKLYQMRIVTTHLDLTERVYLRCQLQIHRSLLPNIRDLGYHRDSVSVTDFPTHDGIVSNQRDGYTIHPDDEQRKLGVRPSYLVR